MTNNEPLFSTVSAFAARACPPRQRKTQLLYSAGLTLGLVGLAVWLIFSAIESNSEQYWPSGFEAYVWVLSAQTIFELADILAMVVLSVGCFVVLPASVAALVSTERKTGTMDQLRATPAKSLRLLAGFVLGAPARIYLILLGPFLFHVSMGLVGVVPLYTAFFSTVVLLVGGLTAAIVGAALALSGAEGKGGSGAMLIATFSLILMFITVVIGMESSAGDWSFVHPAGAINASYLADSLMWRYWALDPWDIERFSAILNSPLHSTLFLVSIAVLLSSAATRRIAHPGARLLRSYEACGLFAIASIALVLPVPLHDWRDSAILPLGLLLLPVMAVLLLGTQPSPRRWAMALRKSGVSAPWGATFGMIGIFAATIAAKAFLSPDAIWKYEYQHDTIEWFGVGWLAFTATSLAILVQFASVRYNRVGHRVGFCAATAVHLFFQLVCSLALQESSLSTLMPLGLGLGLAVPAIVAWRTAALRSRVRQA